MADTIKKQIENKEEEKQRLEHAIQMAKSEIKHLKLQARELENHARDLQKKGAESKSAGIAGAAIAGLTGLVLAPFTGGASLWVAGGVSSAALAYGLKDASACEEKAKELTESAEKKRKDVKIMESKVRKLSREIEALKSECNTCSVIYLHC